jgi:hypothetical protein
MARSSGLLAYGLLTATVAAGLTVKSRPVRRWRAATAVDLHRFLSLLALGAVALHGLGLALDATAPMSVAALVIPGIAARRPLWTGLGVATAEVMLLLHVSFRLRRLIGMRAWRRVHWASYLAFVGATAHGLMSGTDTARPWAAGAYAGAVGIVVGLTTWRAIPGGGRSASPRSGARREAAAGRSPG